MPLLQVRQLGGRRFPGLVFLLASLGIALPSCTGESVQAGGRGPGPWLRPLGSIDLHEDSAHFIARPATLRIVGPSHDMVIADIGTSRVSVFGRDGSFIREYSAPGSGPGELRGPAATFQLGDSLLGIYNMGHRSLLLFELPAGRFIRSIRLPG